MTTIIQVAWIGQLWWVLFQVVAVMFVTVMDWKDESKVDRFT